MRLKEGVKLLGVKPELMIGLMVADYVWRKHGKELVVTSLVDGKHMKGSDHYNGYGGDLRNRYFTKAKKLKVFKELQKELAEDFIVVLEKTHVHIQYSPNS